jgi:phage shock protein A
MGILDRFTSIVKANINELLDKAEDPAKMVEQYLREATEELAEVKEATAGVMAEEARTRRMYEKNAEEVARYDELAKRALVAGNEEDARVFIAKKQELAASGEALKAAYDAASENAKKMRIMHDKLVSDISTLQTRKEAIKAKVAVAKTQEKVAKMSSAGDKGGAAIDAFNRMEAKADAMLDKAEALQELNATPEDTAAALADKYAAAGATAAVDDELARMKQELGL